MNEGRREYLSYLLRLWRENDDEGETDAGVWRASLERPQAGERQGFASLGDLFAFLEGETGMSLTGPERTGGERG